jgi:hypothetical protein
MSRKPNGRKRKTQSDTFERLEEYWDSEVGDFLERLYEKSKKKYPTRIGIHPVTFQFYETYDCQCWGVCRGYCLEWKKEREKEDGTKSTKS